MSAYSCRQFRRLTGALVLHGDMGRLELVDLSPNKLHFLDLSMHYNQWKLLVYDC